MLLRGVRKEAPPEENFTISVRVMRSVSSSQSVLLCFSFVAEQ